MHEVEITLVDSHIHLNSAIYTPSLGDLLTAARAVGIRYWIVPGTILSDIPRQLEISAENSGCFNAFGLHPWFLANVPKAWEIELQNAIQQNRPVAIGECGLDFSREHPEFQKEIFAKQVALSVEHDLPLIIHSYRAVDDVLKILRQYPKARGVFHALNSSIQQLSQILELGYYVGFGGAVTFERAKRLQRLLAATPLERILLETDGPFQAGSYRLQDELHLPRDLLNIGQFIAEQKSLPLAELAKITTENAIRLFNLEIK